MKFNEDSRVKIPTTLHLMRLGYQYLSLKGQSWDLDTNIFPEYFKAAISKINPGIESDAINRLLEDIKLELDNEDLGRAFFERLTARGLTVHTISSRDAFAKDIKATQVIHNHSGKPEITVVNIQKFQDDPDVLSTKDYDINIQRIFILDEAHRSYNPKGSFLANLYQSDPNAIKIALTGTPLIVDEDKAKKNPDTKAISSKQIFGDYIHKYYYNDSIADG
ncbi:DEAD/DEAH box helicase family protein [Undibacterium sp. TJN19]|uniref:DEAD/DEAH box helicase family protein n=1 Tax=Undibacterium sp. TJN19 TaxID=3413055 RepID=UPI003BEFC487